MKVNSTKLKSLTDQELVHISQELLYAPHFKPESVLFQIFEFDEGESVISQAAPILSSLLVETSLRLNKLCL